MVGNDTYPTPDSLHGLSSLAPWGKPHGGGAGKGVPSEHSPAPQPLLSSPAVRGYPPSRSL